MGIRFIQQIRDSCVQLGLAGMLLCGSGGVLVATGQSFAPGFQVRPPTPEVSERTLSWIAANSVDVTKTRVWVYFTDKQIFNSQDCSRRLEEIRAGLDARVTARRAKSMRGSLVDFLDIPVPGAYVRAIEATGADVVHTSRWLNAISVRAPLDVLREIATLPFVHKVTPVQGCRPPKAELDSPPPPRGSRQKTDRDLFNYGPSYDQLAEIGVITAHNDGYSGNGVLVAVFDTGFKRDHPAFQQIVNEGRILAQHDFVNNDGETMDEPGDLPGTQDHGSACWSTLGGFHEGELIGPAYGATFVLAKTEDVADEQPIEEDNWVAAAEWADLLGVDVISSSLAYFRWYTVDDMDGDTAVTTIGADIAASRGILVCSGAGNMGDQDWYIVTAPADADSIIAVGAVDASNQLAGFSSHGPTADGRTKPEVVARGIGVVCACNYTHDPLDDEFATSSGTSLSCPLVAGSAALLIEAAPSWPPMMVREALLMTADNADSPDNDRGWGRIDVSAAIAAAVNSDAPEVVRQSFDARLCVVPNPVQDKATFVVEAPAGARPQDPTWLEVFDVEGRKIWSCEIVDDKEAIDWDLRSSEGAHAAPGVYLARLRAGFWQANVRVVVGR